MPEFIEENWTALIGAIVALVSLWYVRKSALAAVTSATASRTSAQTAEDVLTEARRQHLISITPYVTARAQKMNEVPHAVRQDSVLEVILMNAGPGIARNIRGTLTVEHGPHQERTVKEFEVSIPPLPPEGTHTIDAPAANSRPEVLAGRLTYTDAENRKHWSRLLSQSQGWECGEGDPPPPEASHADS